MIRQEDYWIYTLSISSALMLCAGLYIGSSLLRVQLAGLGLAGILFVAHITRKNYSKKLSSLLLATSLLIAITLALIAYTLTK